MTTTGEGTPASIAPEVKGASDLGFAFDELMHAFEEFKQTNDARLRDLERERSVDGITTDKLKRLDEAMDEQKRVIDVLAAKQARAPLSGSDEGLNAATGEHKSAFERYVRDGETQRLRGLESKALSVGSDPDGGYLVPDETEATVNRALRAISPIRAVADVRQVSGSVYKKPFSIQGPGTGWVGETAARPETNTPTLAELSFPTMELYAMPAATQALLDDSAVDIDRWIADEVRVAFAEQEGRAFVIGDGVNKPRGFMDYPTIAEASWTWGNLGTLSTGAAGAFAASDPADVLVDLIYALKAGYRAGAHWVMNRSTQAQVRKIKDADGNYIWQPAHMPGVTPTLMGFPVVEAEDMPDIATGATAIAFGDFKRGYLIVDRVGIRVLRDPYSQKPYVLFYTTKRVGGGVQDFDAIKLLTFAA
ncbi:MAG: phage major capsid protein [Pseudomonadota bacterium]